MKKLTILILLFVALATQAQESKITGNWQLYQVIHKGNTET